MDEGPAAEIRALRRTPVNIPDIAQLYSPQHRGRALASAAALVAIVAAVDWVIKPNFSLNFLYLFPIMLAGGFLSRWQIVAMGVCCAFLGELFSPFPQADAATRMAMMSVAFTGTGLFVSELVHKRQFVVEHLQQLTDQVRHRQDAEQQIQILIESSPAAIVTVDSAGSIDLANQAAVQLLAPGHTLTGEPIRNYLPALESVARGHRSHVLPHDHAMQRTAAGGRSLSGRHMVFDLQDAFRSQAGGHHCRSFRRPARPRRSELESSVEEHTHPDGRDVA